MNCLSNKYLKELKSKLLYLNYPSLRQRLRDIIQNMSIDYIEKIIPKKKQFIDNIVKSRNYYVHYDYAIEKKALRGSMLFETFKKLRLILICCLLQNLGISKKMLCDRLSKTEYIMGHNL